MTHSVSFHGSKNIKVKVVSQQGLPKLLCKIFREFLLCGIHLHDLLWRFRFAPKQQLEVLLLQIPKLEDLTLEGAVDFLYPRKFCIDLEAAQLRTPERGNEFE